jgi:hypothetical protein
MWLTSSCLSFYPAGRADGLRESKNEKTMANVMFSAGGTNRKRATPLGTVRAAPR